MTPLGDGYRNALNGEDFPADFRDFIANLNEAGVEYVLVGGYAVGAYGYVRATSDIDFFYHQTKENIERLIEALRKFGAPEALIDASHLGRPAAMTALGAPPTQIELLAEISGVTFAEATRDALILDIDGEPLRIIGLAALRANKQASGRRKDRDDLQHLPTSIPIASRKSGRGR
ncbi:MAG: nucleotidyltransferase [Gemmatimonadaceae bacterium]|nr:nucleotidyltransferase [Gemmatimonadaceae bacterium]